MSPDVQTGVETYLLSDQEVVKMLGEKGITIPRCIVAKCGDGRNMLPPNLRKGHRLVFYIAGRSSEKIPDLRRFIIVSVHNCCTGFLDILTFAR